MKSNDLAWINNNYISHLIVIKSNDSKKNKNVLKYVIGYETSNTNLNNFFSCHKHLLFCVVIQFSRNFQMFFSQTILICITIVCKYWNPNAIQSLIYSIWWSCFNSYYIHRTSTMKNTSYVRFDRIESNEFLT